MHLVRSLALAGLLLSLVGCRSNNSLPQQDPQVRAPIRIQLDGSNPAASEGVLDRAEGPLRFTVGHGRHGIACEGTTFEEGITPLGTFQVNAILSNDRFEMDPALVEQSGKSEEELRESLFTNMNSIDFKGDGETGIRRRLHQPGSCARNRSALPFQHLRRRLPLVQLRHSRHQ